MAVAWLSRPIFVGMSNVGVGPVVCGRAQPEHHTWRRGKGGRRKNDSPYVDSMTKKKKKIVVVVCAVPWRVFVSSPRLAVPHRQVALTAPKMVTGLKDDSGRNPLAS